MSPLDRLRQHLLMVGRTTPSGNTADFRACMNGRKRKPATRGHQEEQVMSNSKRDIRYVGFVSTDDGGRRFDFFVSSPDQQQVAVSVDIPGILFAGLDRIKVQEGAS